MTPQQIGGTAKTPAKIAAARENGKRGGRPSRSLTIQTVETRENYTLVLTLSDGSRIRRSLFGLANRAPGLLRVIRDQFNAVKLIDGVLTWPGEIDLCPFHMIYGPDWPSSKRVPEYLEM